MNFVDIFMGLVVYAVPFIILYFVVAAGVKKGIETSEVGRAILEEHIEKQNKKKK
jgi:hypothetical protein